MLMVVIYEMMPEEGGREYSGIVPQISKFYNPNKTITLLGVTLYNIVIEFGAPRNPARPIKMCFSGPCNELHIVNICAMYVLLRIVV